LDTNTGDGAGRTSGRKLMTPRKSKLCLALAAACAASFLPTASALAQSKVRLNIASSFALSLPLIGEVVPKLAQKVTRASGGTLELRVNEPGALVPALQAIHATSQGSVDGAWAATGNFATVDTAFNMFSSVPFGPGIGEFMAWMYHGGGLQFSRQMFAKHNVYPIPCVLVAPEAAGWFKKEINTPADLRGLKMRSFGLAAQVLAKVGVATQMIAGGDIAQALQLGTIDSAEFSLPSTDQKYGFYQVAKYYYFPGWQQQATFIDLLINKAKWDALSDAHKAIIEQACGETIREGIAESEATQWKAIQEMRDKNGVQIKRFSPEVMSALEKAWNDVVAEESAANPNFKQVYDSYAKFRADYAIWREIGYIK
jgi:TRAP-type mannitol/chloroaromatic compound transport system substrate-binding protein